MGEIDKISENTDSLKTYWEPYHYYLPMTTSSSMR